MSARRAFTLIELLIVVLIVAALGTLSVQMFRAHPEDRLEGAARLFRADAEWARSATLLQPEDPAAVRLKADRTGWMVSRNSSPLVPLDAADGSAMERVLGEGHAEAAAGVSVAVGEDDGLVVEFEPFGGVRSAPATLVFTLPDSDLQCLITFDSESGALLVTYPNP
jgi:prepilin-type N-terminal cleavage/methylation domain-containing protein